MEGTYITMRVETMLFVADVGSTLNQFIVKIANVLGRALRAKGTAAQANVKQELQTRFLGGQVANQKGSEQQANTIVWAQD